jgi:hypothetical protein
MTAGPTMQRIDVVVPVHNEAHLIEASVRILHAYLACHRSLAPHR